MSNTLISGQDRFDTIYDDYGVSNFGDFIRRYGPPTLLLGSAALIITVGSLDTSTQEFNISDKEPTIAEKAYFDSNPNDQHANPVGVEFVGVQTITVNENQDLLGVLFEEVEGINTPGSIDSLLSLYEANPELYTVIQGGVAEEGTQEIRIATQIYANTGEIAAPKEIKPLEAQE